jgi:hypothetical protein
MKCCFRGVISQRSRQEYYADRLAGTLRRLLPIKAPILLHTAVVPGWFVSSGRRCYGWVSHGRTMYRRGGIRRVCADRDCVHSACRDRHPNETRPGGRGSGDRVTISTCARCKASRRSRARLPTPRLRSRTAPRIVRDSRLIEFSWPARRATARQASGRAPRGPHDDHRSTMRHTACPWTNEEMERSISPPRKCHVQDRPDRAARSSGRSAQRCRGRRGQSPRATESPNGADLESKSDNAADFGD